jgi:hypothetical protein
MIILFFIVITGCTSTTKALTLEQVIAAFQNEGMQLHKADENEEKHIPARHKRGNPELLPVV